MGVLTPSQFDFVCHHLAQFFSGEINHQAIEVNLITGDASFRRYARIRYLNESFILMISPPDKVDNQPFVEFNSLFKAQGLTVPEVMAYEPHKGLILLDDLGQVHLADLLIDGAWISHYQSVIALLPHIAKIQPHPLMKPYDLAFIDAEMEIFNQWLVEKFCHYEFDTASKKMWQQVKGQLANSLLMQPQVVMHRDFHSRNIMQKAGQWALIDYQDAVVGPLTYDLVSLLKDCYFVMPDETRARLINEGYQVYHANGLTQGLSLADFTLLFHLTGMQRHLKAAGIFCRLALRDDKSGYLPHVLDTLDYVLKTANELKTQFPVFEYFSHWLARELLPRLQEQLA